MEALRYVQDEGLLAEGPSGVGAFAQGSGLDGIVYREMDLRPSLRSRSAYEKSLVEETAPIGFAQQVGGGSGPPVVLRLSSQTGSARVRFYISKRERKVLMGKGAGEESLLPEMSRAAFANVDGLGKATVDPSE